MNKFEEDIEALQERFPEININLLGCYLCNYDDKYIYREYNGGCKNINVCETIKECE